MRRWFKDLPIRSKLAVFLLASTSFGLFTLFGAMMAYEVFVFREEIHERSEITAKMLGINSAVALAFGDARGAGEVLHALDADPSVLCAHTLTLAAKTLARYRQCADFRPPLPQAVERATERLDLFGSYQDVIAPVQLDGSVVGAVHVRFSLAGWFAELRRYFLILGLSLLATSLLAWRLIGVFQRAISSPIRALVDMMGRVSSEQDYSLRARPESRDEVGALMQGFNRMLAEIQARDEKLKRQNDELEDKVAQRTVELSTALHAAEAGTRAKSDFMATMSHEIRTPLNGVIGMADLLQATPLAAQQRELVADLQRSSELLMAVINDILDFSKIDAGQLKLEPRAVDLPRLAQAAIDQMSPAANGKGLRLECRVGDEVPRTVWVDEIRIRQILGNLLGNAVKFTERGMVSLLVYADRPVDEDAASGVLVHFAARDTGIGMTREQQSHLFQPFSQADASTTRKFGGTGLGLVICQKLAQAMGGEILVASEPGQGSTFTLSLRLRVVAAEDHAGIVTPPSGPGLQGRRVLVVDDDALALQVLVHLAGSLGMHCVSAATGLEALAAVDSDEAFDLALLDLHLPDMTGTQLARHIRERRRYTHLPMLLVTASAKSIDPPERGEDFADVLVKPVRKEMLASACARAMWLVPDAAEAAPGAGHDTRLDFARCRTLVADDNPINRSVVTLMLNNLGLTADTAETGREALLGAQSDRYDLVLMDMQMPDMDGLEAAREIRRTLPPERQPYIVALTANALAGDRERCLAAGMDDYLSKPIRTPALMQALQKMMRRRGGGTGPAAVAPTVTTAALHEEAGAGSAEVVDWTLAGPLRQAGLLSALLGSFFGALPGQLEAIRRSPDARDAECVLHTLRGSSATLGMAQFAALCTELEQTLAVNGAGALDLAALEVAARAAREAFARAA